MLQGDRYESLRRVVPHVSRETFESLQTYATALETWNKSHNLIAASTVPHIWERHILDCSHLPKLAPEATRWLDLGSGSGLPGIVIACLLREIGDRHVTLVEANGKKAAFLRYVVGLLGLHATVLSGRIEHAKVGEMDVVTARALAPLPKLLTLAEPWLSQGARGLFQKGRDYRRELEETADSWTLDLLEHPCVSDDEGVVLEIANLRRKL